MGGGMEANKNRFVEEWGAARENLEHNFRWTRRNFAIIGIFGIAIPVLVYKGIVREFATLGLGAATKRSILQCNVGNKSPIYSCCLYPEKNECLQLHLEFDEADEVMFSVLGPRSVHLAGYYLGGRRPYNPDESKRKERLQEEKKLEADVLKKENEPQKIEAKAENRSHNGQLTAVNHSGAEMPDDLSLPSTEVGLETVINRRFVGLMPTR